MSGLESGIVIEEGQHAIVISDDGAAITIEENSADPRAKWTRRPAVVREDEGRAVYLRPTDAAFEDPDARLSLELKYYFPLASPPPLDCGPLHDSRSLDAQAAAPSEPDAPATPDDEQTFKLPGNDRLVLGLLARLQEDGNLPQHLDRPDVAIQWLDYRNRFRKRHAVLLHRTGESDVQDREAAGNDVGRSDRNKEPAAEQAASGSTSIYVLRLAPNRAGDGWRVVRCVASRAIPTESLPTEVPAGCLLDTWDRPADVGSRAAFWGRVIAVLLQVDGRYAVDFFGEALNDESHCRVWLTSADHPWGRPTALRFADIAIARDDSAPREVSVLAIRYEGEAGEQQWIGIDFPLCRTRVLDQMQRLAGALGGRGGEEGSSGGGSGFNAKRLLGEDLMDELARRLVNGRY